MPSRYQPVQPFTLEALVTMQQWSSLQSPRRKPVRRADSAVALRDPAGKPNQQAAVSAMGSAEPGESK